MGFARQIKPAVFSECGSFHIGFHSSPITAFIQNIA